MSHLAVLPGRRVGDAHQQALQADLARFPPRGHASSHVAGTTIGGGSLTVMAGPCSVEGRDQLLRTADAVAAAGATILRGGAFKPRTSPYSFQGLGMDGLALPRRGARADGPAHRHRGHGARPRSRSWRSTPTSSRSAPATCRTTRCSWRSAGRERPVMLKRGLSATIEEWLMAAEYIVSSGNPQVILCERGIRTFETYTRNTLDLAAVPLLHRLTHLPVIVDPSHATGKRWLVPPMALAAVAGRRGRHHGGGAPEPRRRPLRRGAVADARAVRRARAAAARRSTPRSPAWSRRACRGGSPGS